MFLFTGISLKYLNFDKWTLSVEFDYIYVPGIRLALDGDMKEITAYVIKNGKAEPMKLYIAEMTEEEKKIVKAGSLINYNREK